MPDQKSIIPPVQTILNELHERYSIPAHVLGSFGHTRWISEEVRQRGDDRVAGRRILDP